MRSYCRAVQDLYLDDRTRRWCSRKHCEELGNVFVIRVTGDPELPEVQQIARFAKRVMGKTVVVVGRRARDPSMLLKPKYRRMAEEGAAVMAMAGVPMFKGRT